MSSGRSTDFLRVVSDVTATVQVRVFDAYSLLQVEDIQVDPSLLPIRVKAMYYIMRCVDGPQQLAAIT